MNGLELSPKLMKTVVDRYLSFPRALTFITGQQYSYEGKCYCPFHSNFETPSAKLYQNTDGTGDTLYCFSENKRYRPSNLFVKQLGITDISLSKVFNAIWEKLDDATRESLVNEVQSTSVKLTKKPSNWQKVEENRPELLELFKKNEFSFSDEMKLLYFLCAVK